MDGMKLCKDCTHCRPERHWPMPVMGYVLRKSLLWGVAKCAAPEFLSPVDGRACEPCSFLRQAKCGRAGTFWQPRTDEQRAADEEWTNPPPPAPAEIHKGIPPADKHRSVWQFIRGGGY